MFEKASEGGERYRTQWAEIAFEVKFVKGKQYALNENKGGFCTLGFRILMVVGDQCNFDTVELGLSFSVGVFPGQRWMI